MTFIRGGTIHELEVAQGLITGQAIMHKFGRNSDIDTGAVPETLWNGGGLYSGFSAAAQPVRVKAGGNVNDTIAGTGAQKVTIIGLDGSGNEIEEEVDMAGASASSQTSLSFKRAWRARVTQVGSGGKNAGEITIEQITSTDIMAVMPAGTNRTHISCYTVPAGKTLYLHQMQVTTTASSNSNTQFDLLVDHGGQGIFESMQPISVVEEGGMYIHYFDWMKIVANSDIDLRCTATTSNNVIASGGFHGILVDD